VQCTAPATTAIVSSLPAEKQGVASAVNDTAREVGGALGIAVLGSALNETYQADVREATAGLPETVAADATESLVYAQQAAPLVDRGAELVAAAEQAFVSPASPWRCSSAPPSWLPVRSSWRSGRPDATRRDRSSPTSPPPRGCTPTLRRVRRPAWRAHLDFRLPRPAVTDSASA